MNQVGTLPSTCHAVPESSIKPHPTLRPFRPPSGPKISVRDGDYTVSTLRNVYPSSVRSAGVLECLESYHGPHLCPVKPTPTSPGTRCLRVLDRLGPDPPVPTRSQPTPYFVHNRAVPTNRPSPTSDHTLGPSGGDSDPGPEVSPTVPTVEVLPRLDPRNRVERLRPGLGSLQFPVDTSPRPEGSRPRTGTSIVHPSDPSNKTPGVGPGTVLQTVKSLRPQNSGSLTRSLRRPPTFRTVLTRKTRKRTQCTPRRGSSVRFGSEVWGSRPDPSVPMTSRLPKRGVRNRK